MRQFPYLWIAVLLLAAAGGCGDSSESDDKTGSKKCHGDLPGPLDSAKTTESPPEFRPTEELVALNNRGVGLMGKFEYAKAQAVFQELVDKHPDWLEVKVNLGIALLNQYEHLELKELSGKVLREVLELDGRHLRANYCLAILLHDSADFDAARDRFKVVAEADPTDGYAAYYLADCFAQRERWEEALTWYQRSAQADPYLVSGFKGVYEMYQRMEREEKEVEEVFETYDKLSKHPRHRAAFIKYTLMGPKGLAITVDTRPVPAPKPVAGPLFAEPQPLVAPMARAGDANPSVTVCDINGDGQLDVFLAGARNDAAPPNVVALATATSDGSSSFSIAADHPLAAVTDVNAALWGDFDNDHLTDVYLCRRGPNQLWRQTSQGEYQAVTADTKTDGGSGNTVDGAMIDADHDADLDLFLIRADGPNELLINNADGTFRPIAAERGLAGDGRPSRGLVVTDLDSDRDADLIVIHAQPPHEVFANDRLWKYHTPDGWDAFRAAPIEAAIAADADVDGNVELYTLAGGKVTCWQPDKKRVWQPKTLAGDKANAGPSGAEAATASAAQLAVADVNGDGKLELLHSTTDGWRCVGLGADNPAAFDGKATGPFRWSLAMLDPATGPAVIGVASGQRPLVWRAGAGRHAFLGLSLTGKIDPNTHMKSNASGIGVKLVARVQSRWTALDTFRGNSGPGQSQQPLAIGLGGADAVDFITLDWPDAAYETEQMLEPGKLHVIEEMNRLPTSCPILFFWDGKQFRFLTDCLGVGGLGYATGFGEYATPRPWENLLLPPDTVAERDGRIAIKMLEPSEEITYLDAARLVAYDLPPGWRMTLDERMGIAGPQPTGEPRFFRREVLPVRAENDRGEDVTALVTESDLRAAPPGKIDRRFIGRTDEHTLTLMFDEPFTPDNGQPVLVADSWIEYPYSQTMFAAWQAGADYRAPTLELRGANGQWQAILRQFGYPAGMPRQMSLPLPMDQLPDGCTALRLRTNQEIYWDRVAIAFAAPCVQAVRQSLPLVAARLQFAGFPERTVGPHHQPDFNYNRRRPIEDVRYPPGFYTRFGPISPLVESIDDVVAIFGPGEEAHLEFTAPSQPPASGWTRWFVLETNGWCKDTDLYTRDGDGVGPLPRRDGEARDDTANEPRDRLHREYNRRHEAGP